MPSTRDARPGPISSVWCAVAAAVAIGAVVIPVVAAAAPRQGGERCRAVHRTYDATRRAADAEWAVQVGDPAVVQEPLGRPVPTGVVRQRWRLNVRAVTWQRGPGAGRRPPPVLGSLTLVDDADWPALQRCRGDDCLQPCVDTSETDLARPPRPGDRLRVAVRWQRGSWRLAALRAMVRDDGGGARR